ncbi:hypothetical protein EJB05_57627 [Eragrostis curvula]|uniref:General transcription factor 3C polypeptide 3 n=1 Tax=Eragrostis curvula TaxID=38414 RepID=A0A5J9SDG3_9POAL|nr:hypothetical protein EJB05_57627 [Eragrostis curvula]
MMGTAGTYDRRVNAAEDCGLNADEDGYELGDAEKAMPSMQAVERSAAARAHDYEELAARKRKALSHEQLQRGRSSKGPVQYDLSEAEATTMFDQLMEGFSRWCKRSSKVEKKRGRKKGTKNKCSPEVTKKLGDATLLFTDSKFKKAISILHEIVRIAPNLSKPYYLLGCIYAETGKIGKAINFLMLAAHVSPKDAYLWKKLIGLAREKEDAALARYCILRAMRADPEDTKLKYICADIYCKLNDYHKAAQIYEQIVKIDPTNVFVRKVAAQLYRNCGHIDKAITLLEEYANNQSTNMDWSVLDLLISLYLRTNATSEALKQIEKAHLLLGSEQNLPVQLHAKAVICHASLGDMKHAEVFLQDVHLEPSKDNIDVIKELASTFENMEQYEYAVKFYLMIENVAEHDDCGLYVKVAQCYMVLGERRQAIPYFYKALEGMKDNIDIRITLSSLLVDDDKTDEAVTLLSPHNISESQSANIPDQPKPWWCNGEVKMQLAKIYYDKGKLVDFVDTIFLPILETLKIEHYNQKVTPTKRLPGSVPHKRVKLFAEQRPDVLFQGIKPIASPVELPMANRAKKLTKQSTKQVPPVPGLLTNLENHQLVLNVCIYQMLLHSFYVLKFALGAGTFLIIVVNKSESTATSCAYCQQLCALRVLLHEEREDFILDCTLLLCRTLASLQRYSEALEIINCALELGSSGLSVDIREELRSLGAHIAYRAPNPSRGLKYVCYRAKQHPYSLSAWNSFYQVTSRIEEGYQNKFILQTREEQTDCVPPIIISGHRFTALSQHQAAARDYLEAYKLEPKNPLIVLCVGTALINLALGFRLQNKNQCIVHGFAFLYKYLRLCGNSQEALYNIARAYHHIGLITLAAVYYEKVLAIEVKDHPIPKLPYEAGLCTEQDLRPGYCDVQREAAFNLHLIYKKSGAADLSRRILKTYCTV